MLHWVILYGASGGAGGTTYTQSIAGVLAPSGAVGTLAVRPAAIGGTLSLSGALVATLTAVATFVVVAARRIGRYKRYQG